MSKENTHTFNLCFSTVSKKYGYWDEILNEDASDAKVFNKLLKEELHKASNFVGDLTFVEAEVGSVGGGESNMDVTYSTTFNCGNVENLLKNKDFLSFLESYYVHVGSGDAYWYAGDEDESYVISDILANMGHETFLNFRNLKLKCEQERLEELALELKPILENYTKEEILNYFQK